MAPQNGFKTIDIIFHIDIEFGLLDRMNMLPKPFLDSLIEEYKYLDSQPADGPSVYRLAPPGSFLSSFIAQRLAWDPKLTREELLSEVSGYLTDNETDKEIVAKVIDIVESYLQKRDIKGLYSAKGLLSALTSVKSGSELELLVMGTDILCMVAEYAMTALEIENLKEQGRYDSQLEKKLEAQCIDVFEAMKKHEVYQGFTSDVYWEPRAINLRLKPAMESWAIFINHMGYGIIVQDAANGLPPRVNTEKR